MSPNIDPLLDTAAAQQHELRSQLATNRRWVKALRNISQAVLNEEDVETALETIVDAAAEASLAAATMLFLPSVGDLLTCEFCVPTAVPDTVGMSFPEDLPLATLTSAGRNELRGALFTDVPLVLRSLPGVQSAIVITVGEPAAPTLTAADEDATDAIAPPPGELRGALVLLSDSSRLPFTRDDLEAAITFVTQVIVALEVATVREAEARALLWEERDRIRRDLHDLAVQQLFAVGMRLDTIRIGAETGELSRRRIAQDIGESLSQIEEAVNQIRVVVHGLKEVPLEEIFTDRLQTETSQARHVLGFAPSLVIELDDSPVAPNRENTQSRLEELSDRVPPSVADDAIATVREALSNISRHANARSTTVTVSVSGHRSTGELVISVVDDGTGVDPTQARSSGLANMSARAGAHGGSFAVGAGPRGRGTSLVWRAPLS